MKRIEIAENLKCGASSKAARPQPISEGGAALRWLAIQAISGAVVGSLIRVVEASGWRGPVGVIHERGNLDAAEGIKGSLQGLEWVQKELRQPGSGGPKPQEPTPPAKVLPKPAASRNPQPDTKNSK